MDLKLAGKTAIVTGGTSGIGRAVTEMLASEGCNVAACDIEPREAAEAFVKAVSESTGTACLAIHTDVSKEEDVARMSETVISEFGGYDILVNNAALCTYIHPFEMELAEWKKIIDIDLTGVFLTSKTAIKHFIERGTAGRIINLTSQAAFRGTRSGHSHYAAAKAGVVGLTRTQALETAKYGICVNAVAPGIVDTPQMGDKILGRKATYEEEIPIGRIAEPEDVAYAIVFLASEMGRYITGSTLDASGGIMLR